MPVFTRLGSFDRTDRSMTIPVPQTPWMEFASWENACSVAAVAALDEVELLAAVFFFEPPEEQAPSTRAATTGSTMNRFMGCGAYL